MSGPKSTSYTITPKPGLCQIAQDTIIAIQRQREKDKQEREQKIEEQSLKLQNREKEFVLERALEEFSKLRESIGLYGVNVEDIQSQKPIHISGYDTFSLFVQKKTLELHGILQELQEKQSSSDFYATLGTDTEGEVLKITDIVKPVTSKEMMKKITKESENIQNVFAQIAQLIKEYTEKTKRVLEEPLFTMVDKLYTQSDMAEIVRLELSIKDELDNAYHKIEEEKNEVRGLLSELEKYSADSYVLKDELKKVLNDQACLDVNLVNQVNKEIDILRESTKKQAASILKAGLEELGYEVSGIEETLFIEGGEFYFRNEKEPWDENYYMRASVDPQMHNINFRMIFNSTVEHSKVQDKNAEDRWCQELPTIQKALEQKQIALKVTSYLPAGERPVESIENEAIKQKVSEHFTRQNQSRGLR